jgi:hypothetical protein
VAFARLDERIQVRTIHEDPPERLARAIALSRA